MRSGRAEPTRSRLRYAPFRPSGTPAREDVRERVVVRGRGEIEDAVHVDGGRTSMPSGSAKSAVVTGLLPPGPRPRSRCASPLANRVQLAYASRDQSAHRATRVTKQSRARTHRGSRARTVP
ncbi:MAG: hypothetical protein BGO98_25515 [Myxococcales bacterium 68-20]|nr:MAG: hypothetical protein BGO98_25515 [Myxococcales bacterium 68-20]